MYLCEKTRTSLNIKEYCRLFADIARQTLASSDGARNYCHFFHRTNRLSFREWFP